MDRNNDMGFGLVLVWLCSYRTWLSVGLSVVLGLKVSVGVDALISGGGVGFCLSCVAFWVRLLCLDPCLVPGTYEHCKATRVR